jgi:hypothetical protein
MGAFYFIMKGWIKIHRQFLEWEWYDDVNVSRIFIHLLLRVNHVEGYWKGVNIKAGELITSYSKLSMETGLSIKQIRRGLSVLEESGELGKQKTNKYTHLKLINWEKYQNDEEVGQTKDKQKTNKGQQYKNVKNVKNIYCEFSLKFFELLKANKMVIKNQNPESKTWVDPIRKLVEVDGIDFEDVKAGANYYFANLGKQFLPDIRSTKSFRDKFESLVAHKQRNQ